MAARHVGEPPIELFVAPAFGQSDRRTDARQTAGETSALAFYRAEITDRVTLAITGVAESGTAYPCA